MMNSSNYFTEIKKIDVSTLPTHLQKGHGFVVKATENGSNWDAYKNENIKRVIDGYFAKLDEYLQSNPGKSATPETVSKEAMRVVKSQSGPKHKKQKTAKAPSIQPDDQPEMVERTSDEIRFIKRYVGLHNKEKSKDDLLRFINALHRAILERRIRKTSTFAKQIEYIQDKLISRYNEMRKPMVIQIAESVLNEFKALIGGEKVWPTVGFIKRYISLNGKYGVKEKAKKLYDAMTKAFEKGKIKKGDQYYDLFKKMHFQLNTYSSNKTQKYLFIEDAELSGLNSVLSGCNCQSIHGSSLDGIEQSDEPQVTSPKIISSVDFVKENFKTLGFTGKYLAFIGDPCPGFTASVSGPPKMGKTALCIDFAGYLAHNHGRVLYVSKEEKFNPTLQEKLKTMKAAHPNLEVADDLPEDLSFYHTVFLDSVTKLKLTPSDLEELGKQNPGVNIIGVHQVTKMGKVRGTNEYMHDVDVIIQVPEKGRAIQNGRFNQGGEMQIFEQDELQQAA